MSSEIDIPNNVKPSYKSGYARSASESASPGLWKNLIYASSPSLGVSGEQLFDLSGFGNHGVLVNKDPAADWVVDEQGYMLDYQKSGSGYVDFGTKQILNTAEPFSVSWWMKPATFTGNDTHVCNLNSTSTNFSAFLFNSGTYGDLSFGGSSLPGNPRLTFPGTVAGTLWHVVLAFNGGSLSLEADWSAYVNGKEVTVNTGNNFGPTPANNWIGSNGTHSRIFDGTIGDFLLHSRELTASDAAELYRLVQGGIFKKKTLQVPFSFEAPLATGNPWYYNLQQQVVS